MAKQSSTDGREIPPPRAQLRVGGSRVKLQFEGRDDLSVEPAICHRSRMDFQGFGRLESYEYGRFQHRIEAVILPASIEQWAKAEGIENPPTWNDLESIAFPGTQPHLTGEDPSFVVGRIELEEHPRITKWRLQMSWGDWLRAIDSESALLGDILDSLEDSVSPTVSIEPYQGSLFHIRRVAVHPAFQGQAVGRRLIAHALWTMHRGIGDVAMIPVLPTANPLGVDEKPDQSPAAIRQLSRYYQRMGFQRSVPGKFVAGEPVPMHHFFGVEPLRVSGLHELGIIE